MALNLTVPSKDDLKPRITVFGVGGAGGNAVNNMIEKNLEGVEFVVANTDAQALQQSGAVAKIQMGVKVTEGLGAGARPAVGAAAAEESIEEILDHLAGAHMCFITAGMGGGTGTGAAPIIAQAARELGVLTVGVVTKPFQFEGAKRMRQAEEGVEALQKMVDTLIIIPNQNLFRLANEKTTFTEAFAMADDVLYQGVKGVTDLMVRPGLINLDFADVRAVMDEMGKAMMGTGEASGEDRAIKAAEKAIANPLLDEISLKGARGVLINITGGHDLTLFELDEAANRIREEVDAEANIIVGSTLDTELGGMMRVSVVATGIDAAEKPAEMALPRRRMAEPLQAPEKVEEKLEAVREAAPVQAPVHAETRPQTAPVSQPQHQHQQQSRTQMPTAAQLAQAHSGQQQPYTHRPDARQEPSLFEDFDPRAAAAQEQVEDIFEDDLPAPAYQPAPRPAQHHSAQQQAAQSRFGAIDESEYVAPRPAPIGQSSPEAAARMKAAAASAMAGRQPMAGQQRPAPAPAQAPAEKPRFGINSLINRMTGHASDEQRPAPAPRAPAQQPAMSAPQRAAQQPQYQAYEDEAPASAEQDRIEIPAFLRRQAN